MSSKIAIQYPLLRIYILYANFDEITRKNCHKNLNLTFILGENRIISAVTWWFLAGLSLHRLQGVPFRLQSRTAPPQFALLPPCQRAHPPRCPRSSGKHQRIVPSARLPTGWGLGKAWYAYRS